MPTLLFGQIPKFRRGKKKSVPDAVVIQRHWRAL